MRPVVVVPVKDLESAALREVPDAWYRESAMLREVSDAWYSGEEFVIDDETCKNNGKRITKTKNYGYKTIHIRYNGAAILVITIIMNQH